jgi:hypothetical protein
MNNKLYHMMWISAYNMINESSGVDMIYTAKEANLGKALNERDKQSDVMQLRS